MDSSPLLLMFITAAILNIGLAIYGWQHRRLTGATAFSLAMFLFAALPLAQAVNESSTDLTVKVIALKSRVETAGIGTIAWFVMIAQLAGFSHLANRRSLVLLSIVPFVILILNWTENPLFRSGYSLDSATVLHWKNGPFFWFGLAYLNLLLIAPLYLLWRSYHHISPLSVQQTLALSVSTLLPILLNVLIQVGIVTIPGIKFPFAAGPFMGLIVVWAVFRYHVFNMIPIARGLLIENMGDGVLVLDHRNRIVDINPAMKQLIGPVTIGQSAELAFAHWPDLVTRFRDVPETQTEVVLDENPPQTFDLRISPLYERHGQLTGRLIVVRDITAHKQTENALRASESNFRRMIDSAPDAILIVDQAGTITLANEQCGKMFRYSQSELLSQPVEVLIPEPSREIHTMHRTEYFRNPQARSMGADRKWELFALRKDGSTFPVEISLSPLDSEGRLLTMAAVRDITGRKQMEAQLRLQAAALGAAANAIVITDYEGLIQWVNPAFTQLTGYTFGEAIGQPMKLLRSGRHGTAFYETIWNTIHNGEVWEGEIINRRKEGSEYIEHQTITPVQNERGEISHFVAIKQNVTERKRAEESLREAEFKYRTLVEQMPAAMYIDAPDETGASSYVSPQIEALLGYPLTAWESDPYFWFKCLHPEDRELATRVIHNSLMQGRVTEEYRMVASDGREVWIRDHSILVRNPDGQPHFVQGFLEDVTERKQAEEALRQKSEYLESLHQITLDLLNRRNVDEVLQGIVDRATELLGAPYSDITLWDGKALIVRATTHTAYAKIGDTVPPNEGMAWRVFSSGQPMVVDDYRHWPSHRPMMDPLELQAVAVVPVMVGETCVGELSLARTRPNHPFEADQIRILSMFAQLSSLVLDHTQLFADAQREIEERRHTEDTLRRQNDYFETLHQISLDLLNRRNVDDLLNAIINHATRLLDAPYADLDIVEGDVMIARAYSENQSFEEGLRTQRGAGAAASWQVYDTRQPVIIDDYANWPEQNPVFKNLPIHATIIVPLISGDDCLGVFSLSRSEAGHSFTSDEVQLAALFAQQVALALDNAQLHASAQREIEERKRTEDTLRSQNDYLAALHEVTLGLINRRDPDAVLEGILIHVASLMKTQHALVDIVDPAANMLVQTVALGSYTSQIGYRVSKGEGLTGRVWESKEVMIVPDYSKWEGSLPEFRWLRTVAAIPMTVEGHVIGVIGVAFDQPDHTFTPEEIELLQRFANLASMALDNAQLITAALRQSKELSLLHEIRTAIAQEIDLTRIVKRTVEAIAETFGYTLVSLYLLEDDMLILQHQVGYDQVIPTIPVTEGVSGRVIRTGKPIFLEDAHSDPSFLGALEGIVSEVAVPIFDEGRIAGILNIESRYGVKLTEADLRLTLALSDQISVAIGRARLYANLRRNNERLSMLHETTLDLLKERNIEDLLQAIVDQASTLLNTDIGYLALEEGNMLADRAFSPRNSSYQKTSVMKSESKSPVWKVFDSHEPFITTDYSSLPDLRPETVAMGIKACLLLPLLTRETCKGVLGAGRIRLDDTFNEEDVYLGGLFARMAGLTIDNAQLHETLRQESIRDPLTGLFNRRFMEEALAKELNRAARHAGPLALVMLDLDYFKRINDTYGHDGGDKVLRRLSLLLKASVRGSDIICRYGGEEFTLILPDATQADAIQRMEQLRNDIKQLAIPHQGKTIAQFTGSFGIAVFPEHGSTAQVLLKAADEALYRAKQAGRDQIITA